MLNELELTLLTTPAMVMLAGFKLEWLACSYIAWAVSLLPLF